MLHVLTPTGARPEAFAQCVTHMRAQTYRGPVRWVVVDDGPEPEATPDVPGWEVLHLRPEPHWRPGQNTQARNMLAGLEHVGEGPLVIVEDDDRYAPWWLERAAGWLEVDDLVGEGWSVYHNLRTGTVRPMGNARHASLCSTAVRGRAVGWLRAACATGEKFIDIALWRNPGRLYPHQGGVVGIKGYPGRPGIGFGHAI